MHGGPSQVDTFDYKPLLKRDHGKPLPFQRPKVVSERDLQPAEVALGVQAIRAERHVGKRPVPAIREAGGRHLLHQIHVGIEFAARRGAAGDPHGQRHVRAAVMGSWITYGLGSENQNMPGFITICPTQSHGGANNYSSGFLPAPYAGTPIGAVGIKARDARMPYITNTETPRDIQRMELDFVQRVNREQLEATGPDAALEGRIESFELAFRMQAEAPDLQDISGESEATQKLYGLDNPVTEDFGRQCLMARRLWETRRAFRAGEPHVQVGSALRPAARPRAERAGGGQAHRRPARRPQGPRAC